MKIILRQALILIIAFFYQSVTNCFALTSEQVLVVANKMAWHSVELAKYYLVLAMYFTTGLSPGRGIYMKLSIT